ncbi:MAG: hypothetical protein LBF33_02350 [Oscillospiraceae bacterium]|jgi:ComF family protein|nr:hypothetical protein [Oscillospiraceae bacterium]
MKIFFDFFQIFFPTRCPYCEKIIISDRNMCNVCVEKILSKDLIRGFKIRNCNFLCLSSFLYNNRVKEAVWRYKFSGKKDYAKSFAKNLIVSFSTKFSFSDFDFVTNVPISKKRLKERGYDQAKILAQEFSAITQIRYKDFLKKDIDNMPQHTLNVTERKTNTRDVYSLKTSAILNGRKILIVDDVVTSGNTFGECVFVLKKGGASFVFALSLASARCVEV